MTTFYDAADGKLTLEPEGDRMRVRGDIRLDARGLRGLRDLCWRDRLPEEPLAPEDRRTHLVQGLRALADWLETCPDLAVPKDLDATVYPPDTLANVQTVTRAMGGHVSKQMDDTFLRLTRTFGPHVTLRAAFYRNVVCTSRVVGHKVIPAVTIPEQTVEVLEWDCKPVLGAAEASLGEMEQPPESEVLL